MAERDRKTDADAWCVAKATGLPLNLALQVPFSRALSPSLSLARELALSLARSRNVFLGGDMLWEQRTHTLTCCGSRKVLVGIDRWIDIQGKDARVGEA